MDHILKASLDRGIVITIMYLKGNIITKRNIKVLEIGDNTIKAHCYLRGQVRVFKRENILAAELCGAKV